MRKKNNLIINDGFEYKMTKTMADALLKERKGSEELKMHPQAYLCQVVNEQFGVKGTCIHVIID